MLIIFFLKDLCCILLLGDVMFTPLGVKTDYSILKSLIKIEDYILYAKNHHLTCLGILDDNLNASHYFYKLCKRENIKPIIGLNITIENINMYLYPKNYSGLVSLFKLLSEDVLSLNNLKDHENIICILNYENMDKYSLLKEIFNEVFLSFKNKEELINEKLITNKCIYIKETLTLNPNTAKYINYLKMIQENKKLGMYSMINYQDEVISIEEYDTSSLTDLIDIHFPESKKYIPKYIENSYEYLKNLAIKGLNKRKNNVVSNEYKERLMHELNTINNMGFTDYFLIVFDYVRFAKKNNILTGVGRGSAAGSLVAYSLGITEIDPLEYGLLFERFLNPERITMPDIDIDFEYTKVDEVYNYVKEKYGEKNVSRIITYGTFQARESLRTIAKINDINETMLNQLLIYIDSKKTLRDNLTNEVKNLLNRNSRLKKVYEEALVIEHLKKNESVHAAGVVISSVDLNEVIPTIKKKDLLLTGYEMEELEELGLLKMDFLALRNLTIISNIVSKIDLDLNNIPLGDELVYDLFKRGDTTGIFQFESFGMKSFLKTFKPNKFEDLVLAIAFYRPGPMENMDLLCDRKNNNRKYKKFKDEVDDILKSTFGLIVYQEQIMEILRVMANYSYAHADIVRRAISKKKREVMEEERNIFISSSIKNGYEENDAIEVFNLIEKFASFGFNKSHSVAYAKIAYQMAYLKVHYPALFFISLLNTNIGGDAKIKEYIDGIKKYGIEILKPDINLSTMYYETKDNKIRLPLKAIKGLSSITIENIIEERKKRTFKSFYDFLARCFGKYINKSMIEILIHAGLFDSFGCNRKTLITNMSSNITYAELIRDLDSSLVNEPVMKQVNEYSDIELMQKEIELFGFYISNHPASKYPECFKQINITSYFDKRIETYVLIDKIKTLKTKKNEDMAFLTGSDETGSNEFVLFKEVYSSDLKVGDLVKIKGRVERRFDKYQIVVNEIKKCDIMLSR